ncbi:hypothetical protein A3C96_04190 [Candidatus Uhrbacteria bacterium RIFCSPHIGHO2_02_FULL_60_10]|uniref:Uncharacterized protein n=1 Tax=Candidatus Uhrbacteria bacterium RIFCSPHIGHO2_02_FULL_60_10 TaxID=1802392 RepID=A0A1F7U766_9BACT|nr:MAG: hypothetical protein A3C96_04190 [Candidatus Uhrbacteria bacterium RIFCSPHIGHO2_02_FULL_60_10]
METNTSLEGKIEALAAAVKSQSEQLDRIQAGVDKARRFFQWSFIVTVATVLLPLVAIALMWPFLTQMVSGFTAGLL